MILTSINISFAKEKTISIVGTAIGRARPCKGTDEIEAIYESGLPPEDENQYQLSFFIKFPNLSRINIKFDTEATVTLVRNFSIYLLFKFIRFYT